MAVPAESRAVLGPRLRSTLQTSERGWLRAFQLFSVNSSPPLYSQRFQGNTGLVHFRINSPHLLLLPP